jgi:hypothetical protein
MERPFFISSHLQKQVFGRSRQAQRPCQLVFSVIFIVDVEIVLILAMSLLFWVLFILEFICSINYRKI